MKDFKISSFKFISMDEANDNCIYLWTHEPKYEAEYFLPSGESREYWIRLAGDMSNPRINRMDIKPGQCLPITITITIGDK